MASIWLYPDAYAEIDRADLANAVITRYSHHYRNRQSAWLDHPARPSFCLAALRSRRLKIAEQSGSP
ncbi:hypothetical protein AJ87_24100 [Rhizobium yanglingense]|nr:hypothetical protein AJ87_24100 [Rhizobium yanglingense]